MTYYTTTNQYEAAWLDSCGHYFEYIISDIDGEGVVFQFKRNQSLTDCINTWKQWGGKRYRSSFRKVKEIIDSCEVTRGI